MITQLELRNPNLIPAKTNTYSPIANGELIDRVLEAADRRNFVLNHEQWFTTKNSNLMHGTLTFDGTDPHMGMQVGLINSYNKMKPVTIALGAQILICLNGCISADYSLKRKHTGEVWDDVMELINTGMDNLEQEYQRILSVRDRFSEIEFSKRSQSELLGRLFVEEEILTPVMANIVKNQIIKPDYLDFQFETLWSFYNHCTHALKVSHPTESIDRHIRLHEFLTLNYN